MSDELIAKIDRLGDKMDHVVQLLLSSIPKHKMPTKLRQLHDNVAQTPAETLERRKEEMMRIFHRAGRQLDIRIKSNQKYPTPIIIHKMEAVPKVILLNRCAVNRFFTPVVEYLETSGMLNAETVLEALSDELVVASLTDTKIKQSGSRVSSAICVFSREEYERIQNPPKVAPKKEVIRWTPPVAMSQPQKNVVPEVSGTFDLEDEIIEL